MTLSKKQFTEIFKFVYPKIIKKLRLKNYKIKVHILSKAEVNKISPEKASVFGFCAFTNEFTYKVILIFAYNRHKTVESVIDTIVHELLHIRLYKFRKLLEKSRKKTKQVYNEEERLVRILTKVIIEEL